MRPSDRHSFRDPQPFRAEWQRPGVEKIELTQDEIDGIVGSSDPEAELRKAYLRKKLETPSH
jgi:hypothetical protein